MLARPVIKTSVWDTFQVVTIGIEKGFYMTDAGNELDNPNSRTLDRHHLESTLSCPLRPFRVPI